MKLYRGIRQDNQTWVCGELVSEDEIVPKNIYNFDSKSYSVYPETVEQYEVENTLE